MPDVTTLPKTVTIAGLHRAFYHENNPGAQRM
jgi:hypothetical protein